MGGCVKCLAGIILRAHFLRANGEPSRITRKPPIALGERRIGVEPAVQCCQQIDHVVGHGPRDGGLVAAKRRGFRCDHIFQQMDGCKCSPIVGGMITKRRFDLDLRPKLRIEIPLNARGAVEAADHPRDDARQRLGEDRDRQCGAAAFLVIGHDQLMTLVGSRARRLDFDLRDNGPRILAAENGGQPFGGNGIGRTGHVIEPPGLGARQTLVRDASSDFQRCKGSTGRCTHDPTPRSLPHRSFQPP